MSGEFKQCPNGHYYQGESCPYCKTETHAGAGTTQGPETEIFVGGNNDRTNRSGFNSGGPTLGGDTTGINTGGPTVMGGTGVTWVPGQGGQGTKPGGRTEFGDEDTCAQREPRYSRKLVGWLVTYSSDPLGVDYKLYEGRNIIGRDVDCNITVNDGRVSGKHAVLLFRANKYSLTDSQSSHGTFVNDEDIDLEPRYLKDGDIIRMGNTTFKFRTSL